VSNRGGTVATGLATDQKVVIGILEDHVNRLVLEDDFSECNDVLMLYLAVEL